MKKLLMIFPFLFFAVIILTAASSTDPKNNVVWTDDLRTPCKSLLVRNQSAVIATDSGIYLLDAKTGEKKTHLTQAVSSALAFDNQNILAISAKTIFRINPASGEIVGQTKVSGAAIKGDILCGPELLAGCLLCQSEDKAFILNAQTGNIIHKFPQKIFVGDFLSLISSNRWRDCFDQINSVIYEVDGRKILGLSLPNLKKSFQAEASEELFGPPTINGQRLFVFSSNRLFAFDLAKGNLVFSTNVQLPKPVYPYIWSQQDGNAIQFVGDKTLYTHSVEKSKIIYQYPLPGDPYPLFVRGNMIYFLMRFTHQLTETKRSVIFAHNLKNAQLYGRSPVDGDGRPVFVLGNGSIAVELTPGKVVLLDDKELEILGTLEISDDYLAGLSSGGPGAIAASDKGKVFGFSIR